MPLKRIKLTNVEITDVLKTVDSMMFNNPRFTSLSLKYGDFIFTAKSA